MSGIVFLNTFSDCSLFVHKNTSDFCVLILYPATLIVRHVSCGQQIVGSYFLIQSICLLISKISLSTFRVLCFCCFLSRLSLMLIVLYFWH
jgi:hypothetical protein